MSQGMTVAGGCNKFVWVDIFGKEVVEKSIVFFGFKRDFMKIWGIFEMILIPSVWLNIFLLFLNFFQIEFSGLLG